MRTTSNPFTRLALAAAIALPWATAAQAAATQASVEVTSFSVSASGGSLSWLPAGSYQALFSESRDAGGLNGNALQSPAPGSMADDAVTTATGFATATAQAFASGLIKVQTAAQTSAGDPVNQPNSGVAWVQQAAEFQLSGPGTVSFVVNYTLHTSAVGGDDFETFAQSALSVTTGSYGNASGGNQTVEYFSFDEASGQGTHSGTLSFTVTIDSATDTGYYDVRGNGYAYASAAVPEPSHLALLAGGLGVVAWRVRRARPVAA